ncbi:hypothetical protein [Photorhabdus namnaonensis]|uniref:Uncharacterized protein n=1 Tax=Photorhabdus namnaonensis TaxID=1851568 RepID=A0A1B8YI39_9GAMM|nr:hypothetical protein [Photorhabdus namnaonensis]OCA54767.1 hypothetical protein Phpb_02115 [Photorhabdus namnaonensis]
MKYLLPVHWMSRLFRYRENNCRRIVNYAVISRTITSSVQENVLSEDFN